MSMLQTLEAKMADIEESLSLSMASRRRKGTSLGSVSSRSSPKLDTILSVNNNSINLKDHDRENIMQNLRHQFGMDKQQLGRYSSASVSTLPLENGEKPVNDQKINRLKNDAENKKNAIKNLKEALKKLDSSPTLDIDSRIRQAELEYALGREELQLLSIVEEARAIQVRMEKERSKSDVTSLCAMMRCGHQLSLHAVQASTGRWNASQKHDYGDGFLVDWVMEGEELQRGDRILEINGKVLSGRSKDELQRVCANTSKCDIVVIRKKPVSTVNVITSPHFLHQNQQQLQQTQADNMRLQHRISYLEEQVKELLDVQKEKSSPVTSNGSQRSGTHITSISISSSPSDHDEDRPVVYQRSSFITTIVDGKPQKSQPKQIDTPRPVHVHKSSSTTNVNTPNQKDSQRENNKIVSLKSTKSLSTSMSRISINTDLHVQKQRRDRERKEREKYYNNKNILKNMSQSLAKNNITASMNRIENSYMKKTRNDTGSLKGHDERSINSLDSDNGNTTNYDDYASEPVPTPKLRATPPKKPLRLSLQRAQSLQAVCGNTLSHKNTPSVDKSISKKPSTERINRRGEQQTGSENNMKISSRYSKSIEIPTKYIKTTLSPASNHRQRFV